MDVADAIADMHARGRYRKLFLMVETCQASTMFAHVKSPNVFMLAASKKGVCTPPEFHPQSSNLVRQPCALIRGGVEIHVAVVCKTLVAVQGKTRTRTIRTRKLVSL